MGYQDLLEHLKVILSDGNFCLLESQTQTAIAKMYTQVNAMFNHDAIYQSFDKGIELEMEEEDKLWKR